MRRHASAARRGAKVGGGWPGDAGRPSHGEPEEPVEPEPPFSDDDYRALAAFRAALRRFVRFSEDAARAAGLSPQQHQILVAIRGHVGEEPPTIGELAEALQIRHHSAVGLVDRMAQAGYVRRVRSTVDSRRVHVAMTPLGEVALRSLATAHRQEYHELEGILRRLTERFGAAGDTSVEALLDTALPAREP
ncbi:MAG: MarR family transcriptional regulator [Thermomicrobiales bacterium]|nr:MarR family transcriptional regulator [Thermomicrobiales bacterium]